MRVLVEFFDREPVVNVLASCIFKPDVVVFLCDSRDSQFLKESAVYRLFKRRGIKTQPRFYYFNALDPLGVHRVMKAVVRDYPGCVFDFSGGSDLVLVVAGAFFSENKQPGFYIDVNSGRFINLYGCEEFEQQFEMPVFLPEEVFAMTGATVHGYGHFALDELNEDFEKDVLTTFEIVQKNPKAWSEFVSWLQNVCSGKPMSMLQIEGPRRPKGVRRGVHANPVLLQRLRECGLFTHLHIGKNHVEMHFKSVTHRKCLLVEGVWLELFCYVTAKSSGLFDEVRTSVVIDWDGVVGGTDNAKNEVDVFLVKGVTPVFISCKMSLPSALAISEIRLLATRFGGRNSRAVIVTAGRLGNDHKALQSRADELGITIIDKTWLEKDELLQRLKHIAGPIVPANRPRLVDSRMLSAQP